ncbi:MAG TPA: GAF domain-containing sensor histidine kinase [Streptosporangiaceae bacterium]|nr:GAF domain-containing sensor histidine kinase [Streptosporangiaceae bacterium]
MSTRNDIPADPVRRDGPRSPSAAEIPGGARAADAVGGLGFPDMPRLELDQLLVQLVDRADDVLATQGRLRGLLRANALVAGELSLPVVLRQIVGAARDLVGARYAALGVHGRDGELEQFVHAGMGEELAGRIGELPRGRGILGLLIAKPVPLRLADLSGHPASAGFPPGHPPMTGFLGVPVRSGEEVFGNLYLTERSRGGEFTAEDEQLAIALAAAAGAAIANARRFAESEQRRRWLDAAAELTSLLSSGKALQPHTLITQLAAAAADADFGTLTVPHGADQVIVTGVTGELAAGMTNQVEALADSLAGQAIRTGKPSLVTGEGRQAAAAVLSAGTGLLIVVPLTAGEQVRGALLLGRLAVRPEFTGTDLGMAASFASHAAVAMELLRARADQIALAQAEDHDRIAGDLHDHVIQELFSLGMRLQGHAARCDPAAAELVNSYADTLDEVIKKIRTSIFGLHHPRAAPAGLPARVMEIIDEHTAQLGFTAGIHFTGPLDPGPDEALAHDILAVTREALSNCARHAHATAVTISLVLQDGLITLDITDNGRGLGTPARSSGLSSMRRRAERNGGTFQLTTPADGGTHLAWTARPH